MNLKSKLAVIAIPVAILTIAVIDVYMFSKKASALDTDFIQLRDNHGSVSDNYFAYMNKSRSELLSIGQQLEIRPQSFAVIESSLEKASTILRETDHQTRILKDSVIASTIVANLCINRREAIVAEKHLTRTLSSKPLTSEVDQKKLLQQLQGDSVQAEELANNQQDFVNQLLSQIPKYIFHASLDESRGFRTVLESKSVASYETASKACEARLVEINRGQTLVGILDNGRCSDIRYLDSARAVLFDDLTKLSSILRSLENTVGKQRRARSDFAVAMEEIESANAALLALSNYAKSEDIARCKRKWDNICRQISQARDRVNDTSKYPSDTEKQLCNRILEGEAIRLERAHSKAIEHRDFVNNQLAIALDEEATFAGRLSRGLGRTGEQMREFGRRLLGRANEVADDVSQSRIGQELGLSVDALVLGTKVFYDFLDVNTGTDLTNWAMSYERDFNQLMEKTEEVRHSEGASLTGKNTIIEDLINRGYDSRFSRSR
ncbi:hypothetical protein HUU59_03185 [bacterium]|nr:hypothetical protein [bacterium]